jgi:PhnB protein
MKERRMRAYPYVFFADNCREAFHFYQSLGIGTIESMIDHGGLPPGTPSDPARANMIMHAALTIGDGMIMASDSPPEWYRKPQGFNIHVTTADAAAAERLFAALSKDGDVQMPLEETFWALRFGACVDRFGIPWMVSADRPAA